MFFIFQADDDVCHLLPILSRGEDELGEDVTAFTLDFLTFTIGIGWGNH